MNHRAQRYNAVQPWTVEGLPGRFVELIPYVDDHPDNGLVSKSSYEFAELVQDFQSSFGLHPDGMLGPRTLKALSKEYAVVSDHTQVERCVMVNKGMRPAPFEVYHGAPFWCRVRPVAPTRVDVHESVTDDPDIFDEDDTTERILRRKKCGVHLMLGPDGSVVQHNDLVTESPNHVSKHNKHSIGIEVVGPYYKASGRYWTNVIDAPWAHKGKYAVPPLTQLEMLYLVIRWIWEQSEYDGSPLSVSKTHRGVRPDPNYSDRRRVNMGRTKSGSGSGIWAHGYTGHADGYFPLLYVYLRMCGRTQLNAYREAIMLATGAKKYVVVDLNV